MKDWIVSAWVRLLLARPGTVVVSYILLGVITGVLSSRLTVDTNQLNLLDPEVRQVKDAERITDMAGGAGFLILALRGSDGDRLKRIADAIATELRADTEHIRSADARLETTFLRERAAMFVSTEDLAEIRRRVMLKLKDVVKRASPFFFEIKKTEPLELELSDILDKYERVGKKRITDDHYISVDRKMVLVLIKPRWDSNQLTETAELVSSLRTKLAALHPEGAQLVEDYDETPPSEPQLIEYGFTGTYKTNFDDSNEIKASLVPVGSIAFIGVLITMLLFFRRQLALIALVVSSLVLGMLLTFGFAYVAVGQLNIITGILGGILMGFGIDFGIHFSYRLRYELKRGLSLAAAIEETVSKAGPASFASAAGVGVSFLSLLFSEFRGFSEFGLLAGFGTFAVGATMYLWVPALLLWLDARWPGAGRRVLGNTASTEAKVTVAMPTIELRRPGRLLLISVAITAAVAAFAPKIEFEYNTRALMIENQPSVRLQDEIHERFQISADPVAISTRDLAETREVYDLLRAQKAELSTVETVVSIFTFVPPAEQQAKNAELLAAWKQEVEDTVDASAVPPEFEAKWKEIQTFLGATPFGVDDLPPYLKQMVTSLPTAKPENQGYLTFVYAGVDLWDGRQMLAFADQVETLRAPSGKEYHAAGLPILFAKLARIVLHDGRTTVLITGALLVLILLLDFRSLRDTLISLLPLSAGMCVMLGLVELAGQQLNFMNLIVFPIILGYGVSHGVYLLHRFNEGASPFEALRVVGAAVACSTITSLAGWGALLFAAHKGLKSMGVVACFGMVATLLVSFAVMLPLLEILHVRRTRKPVVTDTPLEEKRA